MEFDPRIVTVAVEVEGKLNVYSDLFITASGSKTANTLQNEFTITIMNLKKSVRDYLIKETSPLNRPRRRKKIILYAGRKSYGTFKVFEGDITQSSPSQPPDIGVTIKARTASFFKTDIFSTGYAATIPLSKVSADAAQSMDLTLDFQASDKNISNYNYTGSKLQQVDKLASAGNYNAYIDDDRLVVKNADVPLTNAATTLNKNSGMVGAPEVTEEGV